jgi:Uncharacterized conserved protein
MSKIAFYAHGGSKNHGCEAIVRATSKIISIRPTVYSFQKKEDDAYGLNEVAELKRVLGTKRYSIARIYYRIKRIITSDVRDLFRYQYKYLLKEHPQIACSVGGDNYCYGVDETLILANRMLNENNIKTVLFGCSIEPGLLNEKKIVEDLNIYSLITARESITYRALLDAGIARNLKLFPDPAFLLDKKECVLPPLFLKGNTIGINVSPLIQKLESGETDITYKNYSALVKYILTKTDSNIALIPHVIRAHNDDLEPLKKLFHEYQSTGRIFIIDEDKKYNCMELKYIISNCRLMVVARTHASIAAYSTCVPTLVVGYSVKARGIASDLFGTDENYVIPVQQLQKEDDLVKAFQWILEQETVIRTHLNSFMPSYIEKAWQAGEEVRKLLEEPKQIG